MVKLIELIQLIEWVSQLSCKLQLISIKFIVIKKLIECNQSAKFDFKLNTALI